MTTEKEIQQAKSLFKGLVYQKLASKEMSIASTLVISRISLDYETQRKIALENCYHKHLNNVSLQRKNERKIKNHYDKLIRDIKKDYNEYLRLSRKWNSVLAENDHVDQCAKYLEKYAEDNINIKA